MAMNGNILILKLNGASVAAVKKDIETASGLMEVASATQGQWRVHQRAQDVGDVGHMAPVVVGCDGIDTASRPGVQRGTGRPQNRRKNGVRQCSSRGLQDSRQPRATW